MCRGDREKSLDAGTRSEEDLALAEEELTQQVPILLDSMNRASAEANSLELKAGEAQQRYKLQLSQCSELYNGLRLAQGQEFAKVKPYYFASQELKAASHHTQTVAREFSEASKEYERAVASMDHDEAARLKKERDSLEEKYVRSLSSYQAAQKALEVLRWNLGDAVISRATPHFERLQEQQMRLAIEQNRCNTLVERARAARCVYRESMDKLERISESVHEVRRAHAKAVSA
jgi:hypothetical protein